MSSFLISKLPFYFSNFQISLVAIVNVMYHLLVQSSVNKPSTDVSITNEDYADTKFVTLA